MENREETTRQKKRNKKRTQRKAKPPKNAENQKNLDADKSSKWKIWVETLNMNTQFDTNEVTKTTTSLNIFISLRE